MTALTLILYVYMRIKRVEREVTTKENSEGEELQKTEMEGVGGRGVLLFVYFAYVAATLGLHKVVLNV